MRSPLFGASGPLHRRPRDADTIGTVHRVDDRAPTIVRSRLDRRRGRSFSPHAAPPTRRGWPSARVPVLDLSPDQAARPFAVRRSARHPRSSVRDGGSSARSRQLHARAVQPPGGVSAGRTAPRSSCARSAMTVSASRGQPRGSSRTRPGPPSKRSIQAAGPATRPRSQRAEAVDVRAGDARVTTSPTIVISRPSSPSPRAG